MYPVSKSASKVVQWSTKGNDVDCDWGVGGFSGLHEDEDGQYSEGG